MRITDAFASAPCLVDLDTYRVYLSCVLGKRGHMIVLLFELSVLKKALEMKLSIELRRHKGGQTR
jgi:hypothetical protein